jgi:drug/metabolite transporter (DMT)-like permease
MSVTRRAYLSLALICIIWGTTYTAIKYAVMDFPPFLLVGIRQTAAGLLLLTLAFFIPIKLHHFNHVLHNVSDHIILFMKAPF